MNLLDLTVKISVDSDGVEEEIKKTKEQVEGLGDTGTETSDKLGATDVAVGNLIARMAEWGVKALGNMTRTGVMYSAQIETYTAALTTALGSEAAAAEAIEQIKIDAAKTPYSVDGLVSANSLLIQAGESAEDARSTILALTDAVSASGGGNAELQRMAQNLQQIKNTGKATAMDIRQFAIAGIDIYGILADYTGKTTAEVKELDVTYDLLTGALQAAASEGGRFYEANLLQSQALNGQLSTLSDNWQNTLGNAFSGVADILSSTVLPAANEFLEALDPTQATVLIAELTAGVGALGIAALNASEKGKTLLTSFLNIVKSPFLGWTALAVAGVVGITAAVADNINTMKEYTNSLVVTDGTTEDMAANLEFLRQREAQLKAEMDSGWGTEQTMREYDMVRNAIVLQTQVQAEAIAAAEAAADAQNEVAESSDEATNAMSDQEKQLQELATAYVDTYVAMQTQVQGWFDLFENVAKVQSANIEDMKTNLQSQIDFNNQYQSSLQTLAENGYGELAEQIQGMGDAGASYALALSEALQKGNTEEVQAISDMLTTLQSSQNSLAETMTTVSGDFDLLIENINSSTEEPFQIVLEDNAADIAKGVNDSLATIPDLTKKVIEMEVKYSQTGTPTGAEPNVYGAQGVDYVPFDGYTISAHRGEALLTADEAKTWRAGFVNSAPDPNVAQILSVLQTIAAKGLNANISSRSLYNAVASENRTRTRSTNYNGLALV